MPLEKLLYHNSVTDSKKPNNLFMITLNNKYHENESYTHLRDLNLQLKKLYASDKIDDTEYYKILSYSISKIIEKEVERIIDEKLTSIIEQTIINILEGRTKK